MKLGARRFCFVVFCFIVFDLSSSAQASDSSEALPWAVYDSIVTNGVQRKFQELGITESIAWATDKLPGHRIIYGGKITEIGKNPIAFFIPASFGTHQMYRSMMEGLLPLLTKGFTFVLPDLPGFGLSSNRPLPYDSSALTYFNAVRDSQTALMDHFGISPDRKTHVVGYSVGSYLSLATANANKARVKSVFGYGVPALREDDVTHFRKYYKDNRRSFREFVHREARLLRDEDEGFKKQESIAQIRTLIINSHRLLNGVIDAMDNELPFLRPLKRGVIKRQIGHFLAGCELGAIESKLRLYTADLKKYRADYTVSLNGFPEDIPVRLVVGQQDETTPIEMSHWVRDTFIPKAEVLLMENGKRKTAWDGFLYPPDHIAALIWPAWGNFLAEKWIVNFILDHED